MHIAADAEWPFTGTVYLSLWRAVAAVKQFSIAAFGCESEGRDATFTKTMRVW